MLMNHTYPGGDRLCRRTKIDLSTINDDLSCIRLTDASKHVHESGFAGAVFAKKSVHFSGAQIEINRVVSEETGKALRYPGKLKDQSDPRVVSGQLSRSAAPTP